MGPRRAIRVWYYRREPRQMLRVLDALPRDWLTSNSFVGPKNYWVGLAHQMAGNPEAAQLAWRTALKIVEQRLTAEPNSAILQGWKAELLAG